MWQGLQSSEGLIGLEDPLPRSQQEASVPVHVALSTGGLRVFMAWQLTSPRASNLRMREEKTLVPFVPWSPKSLHITSALF